MNLRKKAYQFSGVFLVISTFTVWFLYALQSTQWVSDENARLSRATQIPDGTTDAKAGSSLKTHQLVAN
jgi:hypothetical protein